ncbi:N-6 DNA methylase [Sphingomonas aurantiaca]|uniref:HsdM family class I SAM-dependent methyltransferase n=1 Tax=Sphingomonas aurantiaca TaxID=185949 RepID=UPI002FE061BF
MDKKLQALADRIVEALQRSGVSDPIVAAEQFAILLFLRLLDRDDLQGSGPAARSAEIDPSVFTAQAARYRWREWRRLPSRELASFVSNEVLPYMGSLEKEDSAVASFFRDAELSIASAELVVVLIAMIDALEVDRLDPEAAGAFMDRLLSGLGWQSKDGSLRTPAPLRRLMVGLVDARSGDLLIDPAMGTGGLLAEAALRSSRSDPFPTSDPKLHGIDQSRTLLRIATVNLALRGLPIDGLRRADALGDGEISPGRAPEGGYDVVLCDPPFGSMRSEEVHSGHEGFRTRRREALFLALTMRLLAPGGRAAIVLPEMLLSDTSGAHLDLRRTLVEEFDVLAVMELPAWGQHVRSATRFSLVTFRRPLVSARRVSATWFCDLRMRSFRVAGGDANSYARGMDAALDDWAGFRDGGFATPPGIPAAAVLDHDARTPRSWWASTDEIAGSGYRLDAARWAPVISKWPLQDDPVRLAEQAIDDYRQLIDRLEALHGDLDAWTG